jgi:D-alanine-D-alanine ligase-like ATP-grasp enzyme
MFISNTPKDNQPPMYICVLSASYEDSESPTKDYDPPSNPIPYLDGHTCERHLIKKATAVRQVRELARQNFDLFINLCDGAWDEDRPGIEVVQALERFGVAFTGADSKFYEPTRELMKIICHYWNVPTPAYAFVVERDNLEISTSHLHFPMIVKHPNSYNSIGLTKASRVETVEQLRVQATAMIEAYGGALVEEFIEGREFTVLVVENPDDDLNPIAYTPVEFCFPPGESFKHFDLKWINYGQMICTPCTDPDLAQRLREMAKTLFVGLNGNGYGRCDIRMNAQGELFLLEINPNCSIFYAPSEAGSADFILLQEPDGHRDFLRRIMQAARKRQRRHQKKWKILYKPGSHFGMYAIDDIEAGEVIEPYEERAHYLVTRRHVMQNWSATKREWFTRYAYPITDEVWSMWSDNPVDWKPINHACDPNAWLEGLNLVARRRILRGEQITMDYATFCTDHMQPFVCTCGAPDCRGLIHGTDYLEPFVDRYGAHISDYIRVKRQQRVLSVNGHSAEPVTAAASL